MSLPFGSLIRTWYWPLGKRVLISPVIPFFIGGLDSTYSTEYSMYSGSGSRVNLTESCLLNLVCMN